MELVYEHFKFSLYKEGDSYELHFKDMPLFRKSLNALIGKESKPRVWNFTQDDYDAIEELLCTKYSIDDESSEIPRVVKPQQIVKSKGDIVLIKPIISVVKTNKKKDITSLLHNLKLDEISEKVTEIQGEIKTEPSVQSKQDYAINLSKELIPKYLSSSWKLVFNTRKSSAGLCNYAKTTIYLSAEFINSFKVTKESIKNVLLHEIAHALTPGHSHDEIWRSKAIEIGCDGKTCLKEAFSEHKYQVMCPCGKNNIKRHIVKESLLLKKCKYCHGNLFKVIIEN